MLRIRIYLSLCLGLITYPTYGQPSRPPALDDTSILRPAGYKPSYPANKAAIANGKQLFNDTKLSTNGRSCSSCHASIDTFGNQFKTPYPHAAMNSKARFGADRMNLDEIIQLCMQGPMRNMPFEWGSTEQIDLTTYLLKVQSTGKM